jgi:hypothetical protein
MTILIKNLSPKKLESLVNIIKEYGFKITNKGSKRIEFAQGLRSFCLYSTDVDDSEFGLTTSFDIEQFLKLNYKEKPKHSISLKEYTQKQELSVEDGIEELNWEVTKSFNLNDFNYISFNEDPIAESLFQVNIRGLNHVILDEDVFEGDLDLIISFLLLSPKECLIQMQKSELIEKIKNFK